MPAPKRAQSAYFLWMNENRAKIQKDLGTTSIGDVGKEAGKRWGSLGAAEKKPFEDKAAKEKVAHEKAMEAYKKTDEFKQDEKEKSGTKRKSSKDKDENAPKRTKSAYFFFLDDVRAPIMKELDTKKIGDVAKEAGARWQKLSSAEKKKYEDQAAAAKAAAGK
mmetsp:Transcript_12934/g.28018  ORF Transcript_12934/g.28018 Transcript_12934/m.28018 type:complete len:163 (+) Transcript_12934:69-557(+)